MGQTRIPEQRPEPRGPVGAMLARPADTGGPSTHHSPARIVDASLPTLPLPFRTERAPRPRAGVTPWQSLWRTVKWPIRKSLLGVSLAADAARRRSVDAGMLAVVVLLAIVVAGAIFVGTRVAAPGAQAGSHTLATSITRVEQPALPPLANSVRRFLSARQRFDGAGMWAACDTAGQSSLGMTEAQLQAALDQQKVAGESVTRYVYSGGFTAPDGASHYTIEAYMTRQGQTTVLTWYFDVGKDGLITRLTDVTQH